MRARPPSGVKRPKGLRDAGGRIWSALDACSSAPSPSSSSRASDTSYALAKRTSGFESSVDVFCNFRKLLVSPHKSASRVTSASEASRSSSRGFRWLESSDSRSPREDKHVVPTRGKVSSELQSIKATITEQIQALQRNMDHKLSRVTTQLEQLESRTSNLRFRLISSMQTLHMRVDTLESSLSESADEKESQWPDVAAPPLPFAAYYPQSPVPIGSHIPQMPRMGMSAPPMSSQMHHIGPLYSPRTFYNIQAQGKTRVFVGQVTAEITDDDIRLHFKQFGVIRDVHRPREQKLKSKQFLYVSYATRADLERCVKFSPHVIKGHVLNVDEAVPRPLYIAPPVPPGIGGPTSQ